MCYLMLATFTFNYLGSNCIQAIAFNCYVFAACLFEEEQHTVRSSPVPCA